jgi:eukaryotic-like serine/threonine-protein kinase
MLDQHGLDDRLMLLATHRRRLAHRLRQHARLGEYAPPEVALDIEDAQTAIREIKTLLHADGVPVANHPDDVARASTPSARLTPLEGRNRSRMLQKVRDFWIKGVLENSLHGAALLTLGLEQRPAALADPWNLLMQQPDRPTHQLLPGIRIMEVFDDRGGELLILGEPGSGKTTLLLELTRELIGRAETDETAPMPVVLNLSSWAAKRRRIADWLVDELNTRYDVPRTVAQAWVAADAVLPLLDGLDEMAQDQRATCVAAINAFRRDHGLVALVVCSRFADYEALSNRLRLQGAVLVQPLSQQQIDAYLARDGDQLAALRVALAADPMLRELAETPLLLSLMTLAYQGVSVDALPRRGTVEERRRDLFVAYVERMFVRRGADHRYPRQRTIHWLAWLARGMTRQAQTIFLIEQLQPDLLTTDAARWQYGMLDRLGSGLVCGGGVGLSAWLLSGLVGMWNTDLLLTYGLITGLISGLFGGTSATHTHPAHSAQQAARNAILGALGVGLVGGLVGGLIREPAVGVGIGLIGGLIGGLAGTLAGALGVRPRRIAVVETLRWSWSRAWRAAANGLGVGLVFGLVFGLLTSSKQALLRSGLVGSLSGSMGGSLTFMLVGGLGNDEIEAQVTPNQGIRRSARSAILAGLAFGLIFGSLSGLLSGLVFHPPSGLVDAVVGSMGPGLTFAFVGGLAYGGYACLAHLALRLVLWRSGALPWNYAGFLDYCAERIFLRKVGGGYLFAHRLLLEYFASLDA